MTFEEYQKQAITTMTSNHDFGEMDAKFLAQVLGLVGESGEFADKVKKIIRDEDGKITPEKRDALLKELGDVLWYVNAIAYLLGSNISDVAQSNLDKLLSRKDRGALHGEGDNR